MLTGSLEISLVMRRTSPSTDSCLMIQPTTVTVFLPIFPVSGDDLFITVRSEGESKPGWNEGIRHYSGYLLFDTYFA
ncbi:hypothetical protein [Methanospirillum stamsii]|uniref:hypothetical protein n=1 Tax=Methanospirillum stamsii TaxID=1277351 RepID=UPI001C63FA77|nr:hypothetical protein [Methanospirillum stamsii]